ncbi:AAA family ATPase [Prosthecobacter sp. SYSU 5D2]|uniref:AAA family ATPase n=1 Tax=Prosthecobacter sp. SYSU 5D2 TaxID=3134134 RepID=UPI0031FE68DE
MIQKLSIRNFKSIRHLELDCRRVNVFIGEPNVGKTNILEALALWCYPVLQSLNKTIRVERRSQLHFDNDLSSPVEIGFDDEKLLFTDNGSSTSLTTMSETRESLPLRDLTSDLQWEDPYDPKEWDGIEWLDSLTRYYVFSNQAGEPSVEEKRLACPFGSNLFRLLLSNKNARQISSSYFQGSGLKLNLDSSLGKVMLAKEVDDTFISFQYEAASETLRRMVFYSLALETNSNQVLVFDEPEAHSFPPYTKTLAERIALDDRGNQFFLTTHSPYMLDSLLSKTPASELNVVLCRMENFETKAYSLNQEQIDQIKEWSMDAFFNFDRLLPEKE